MLENIDMPVHLRVSVLSGGSILAGISARNPIREFAAMASIKAAVGMRESRMRFG